MTENTSFSQGAVKAIPLCLGVIPVGISYGILAMQAGLNGLQAVGMSILVMAGSSQLMAIGMIAQGAAALSIVAAVFFLNLRHFVMGSSAMERLHDTSLGKKMVCAFALCDESFSLFSLSGAKNADFLLGANTALYLTWVFSSVIGSLAQNILPEIVSKSFGIAFYAAFLAMLLPKVKGRGRLILLVLLAAGVNALLQTFLPASWAILLSMVACAWAGTFFCEEAGEHA